MTCSMLRWSFSCKIFSVVYDSLRKVWIFSSCMITSRNRKRNLRQRHDCPESGSTRQSCWLDGQ